MFSNIVIYNKCHCYFKMSLRMMYFIGKTWYSKIYKTLINSINHFLNFTFTITATINRMDLQCLKEQHK